MDDSDSFEIFGEKIFMELIKKNLIFKDYNAGFIFPEGRRFYILIWLKKAVKSLETKVFARQKGVYF